MSSSNKSKINIVNAGFGNTFEYDPADPCKFIGTYGCVTCVGVYVVVDEERCFVAHIDTHITPTTPVRRGAFACNRRQSQQSKDEVVKALQVHATRNAWNFNDKKFRTSVKLVCPKLEIQSNMDSTEYRRTGAVICEEVKDFLNMPGLVVDGKSQGFTVDRKSGTIGTIRYDNPNDQSPPELWNFDCITESMVEKWTFKNTDASESNDGRFVRV